MEDKNVVKDFISNYSVNQLRIIKQMIEYEIEHR